MKRKNSSKKLFYAIVFVMIIIIALAIILIVNETKGSKNSTENRVMGVDFTETVHSMSFSNPSYLEPIADDASSRSLVMNYIEVMVKEAFPIIQDEVKSGSDDATIRAYAEKNCLDFSTYYMNLSEDDFYNLCKIVSNFKADTSTEYDKCSFSKVSEDAVGATVTFTTGESVSFNIVGLKNIDSVK